MRAFADVWLAQATSSQQVEYEVQTESGSETVTDTIHDAQAVDLTSRELPDLAPSGTLQLWSFQIAVSPEGIDPDTVLLSTERGMSMIDGRAYLLDGSRYLAVCLYGKDRYQILSVSTTPTARRSAATRRWTSFRPICTISSSTLPTRAVKKHSMKISSPARTAMASPSQYRRSSRLPRNPAAAIGARTSPAEGWLRNLGSRQWYSEKTGAAFEVVYYPSVPVSSQIASYDAGGYDGLAMTRCTVYGLGPESAVYLYGAEGGC